MKLFLPLLLLSLGSFCFSQDTTDVYVLSSSNRLIQIKKDAQISYSLEYRNLKKLNETVSIDFGKKENVYKFFETCEHVLNTDTRVVGERYNIGRNKIDKNTVKVDNKKGGAYCLIKRETLENMRSAMDKQP